MQTLQIKIRQALPGDLSAIRVCAEQAYSPYVERIGRKPAPMVADFADLVARDLVQVAIVDEQICGFAVFYARADHFHLENVAVSPAYQGQGVGVSLIEFVEAAAQQAGFDRVELYTNAMMTENLGFYPRLGYQQFDRRLEDGFDRVYFSKTL